MIQSVCAMLVLLMAARPALAAEMRPLAATPGERRDSGRLVKVAPDGSSIVLEEMGPWQGPGTGVVSRSIHIPPRATVSLVEHTGRWEGPEPGWTSKSVDVSTLRPGDFVTVTSEKGEAVALEIVRPEP